jgi:hypothetical protein
MGLGNDLLHFTRVRVISSSPCLRECSKVLPSPSLLFHLAPEKSILQTSQSLTMVIGVVIKNEV